MAEDKDAKSLEMRITQLENAIGKLVEVKKPVDVSAEEVKAYLKVRSLLDPQFCSIPTPVFRCGPVVGLCGPARCLTECTCGPCNCTPWLSGVGGLGGFGGLGQ
jgi:hypothetical protein